MQSPSGLRATAGGSPSKVMNREQTMKTFLHRRPMIGSEANRSSLSENYNAEGGRPPMQSVPLFSAGAVSAGALAIGALSVGALAIGAVAIGRLVINRLNARKVGIDTLNIGRLKIGVLEIAEKNALLPEEAGNGQTS